MANTTTETTTWLTLHTARCVTMEADPLRVLVYEGRFGAISFTQVDDGPLGEWIIEYAKYANAGHYYDGWRYVGCLPHGSEAINVVAEHYLNG